MYTTVQMQFVFGNLSDSEFSLVKKCLCDDGTTDNIYINPTDCVNTITSYLDNDFIPSRDVELLTSILQQIPDNFDGDIVFSKG